MVFDDDNFDRLAEAFVGVVDRRLREHREGDLGEWIKGVAAETVTEQVEPLRRAIVGRRAGDSDEVDAALGHPGLIQVTQNLRKDMTEMQTEVRDQIDGIAKAVYRSENWMKVLIAVIGLVGPLMMFLVNQLFG